MAFKRWSVSELNITLLVIIRTFLPSVLSDAKYSLGFESDSYVDHINPEIRNVLIR